MPDYHPIDVRYKGPSTSYRGSAKRSETGLAEAATFARPRQGTAPWGGKVPASQQARPQTRPAKAAASAPSKQTGGAAARTVSTARLVYYALIGIVILFTLFGGPIGLFEILGLAPTQMNSIR